MENFEERSGRWREAALAVCVAAAAFLLLAMPKAAFASVMETMEIPVNEGLTLVASVDEEGVLRVDQVVTDGVILLSEGGDPGVDLQSEAVLYAIARVYDGWYQANTGDWYYFVGGKWVTGWYRVDGYWYHFRSTGVMQTGWLSRDGNWYYLRTSSGTPVSGPHGAAVESSWASIDGYWYYFQSGGSMYRGWRLEGTTYYYLRDASRPTINGPDGSMATGWEYIAQSWYYFNANGSMYVGWLNSGGYEYYLADKNIGAPFGSSGYGRALTGFYYYSADWHYFVRDIDRSKFTKSLGPNCSLVRNNSFKLVPNAEGIPVSGTVGPDGIVEWT